jgi:hypothetical protein
MLASTTAATLQSHFQSGFLSASGNTKEAPSSTERRSRRVASSSEKLSYY